MPMELVFLNGTNRVVQSVILEFYRQGTLRVSTLRKYLL